MRRIGLFTVFFVVFATLATCTNVQQWGYTSPGSQLIHKENIEWMNPSHSGHRMRRTFRFPSFVDDERFFPPIDAVFVTHQHLCPNTNAELGWGGPGINHVGIELESAAGECIYSTVEIYSTPNRNWSNLASLNGRVKHAWH